MRYFESRHLKREIELLPEVEGYQSTVRQLIRCSRPRHFLEEKGLKSKLKVMASSLKRFYLRNLQRRVPDPEPGLERIRRNCSVTMLRRIHEQVLKEIDRLARGWPGRGVGKTSLKHVLRSTREPGTSSRPSRILALGGSLPSRVMGSGPP